VATAVEFSYWMASLQLHNIELVGYTIKPWQLHLSYAHLSYANKEQIGSSIIESSKSKQNRSIGIYAPDSLPESSYGKKTRWRRFLFFSILNLIWRL